MHRRSPHALEYIRCKPRGAAFVVRRASAGYICPMFGIGGQEIVIIGLLFLVIFGPSKLPQMARDLGRFVGEARRSIDEFKDELTAASDEDEKDKRKKR
jgi:Tat protein translocase TatB subunit